jgi:hypothetical protein
MTPKGSSSADINSVLERHKGEFRNLSSADEWANEGFSADEVAAWLGARCFHARAAAELRDVGITPEQASTQTDASVGDYADTVGFKVANRHMAVTDARDLLKITGGR